MEFVGKPIFFGPTLMEFVGKPIFFEPTLMEFVGKPIFPTNLNGIRGQANFGPTLMEFVGKPIFFGFGSRVWALGFRP